MTRPPLARRTCHTCQSVLARDKDLPCLPCNLDGLRAPLPAPGTHCQIYSIRNLAEETDLIKFYGLYTRTDGAKRYRLLLNANTWSEAELKARALKLEPRWDA